MIRPKVTILKKLIISPRTGHYRFYSPYLTYDEWKKTLGLGKPKRNFPKSPTIDLSDEPSNYPHVPNIWTEKDLCKWIHETFGPGEYRVLGHMKGKMGSWTFWKGEINDEGFQFEQKEIRRSVSSKKLRKEYEEEEDPEFKSMIAEEISELAIDSKKKRYGFTGYIKSSGRRGVFITWEEADQPYQSSTEPEDDWGAPTPELKKKEKEDIW